MRAPGGSFICPNTSIVLSSTPDSFISSQRSLPSRERSPTPQKAVGRIHRDSADAVVPEVLLDLADEPVVALGADVDVLLRAGGLGPADLDREVDLRELVREHGLDHDPLDLFDPADILGAGLFLVFGLVCKSH